MAHRGDVTSRLPTGLCWSITVMCPWSTPTVPSLHGRGHAWWQMILLAHPCLMVGPPAAEAMGLGATLGDIMVVCKVVEAETHELRWDEAVSFGCHSPRTALLTMTHDYLETIGIDVGPLTGLPRDVRHRRPMSRAEALVHRDSCHRLCTKATLHGHSRGLQWWIPKAIRRIGPAPMTPLPLYGHRVGSLHSSCALRHFYSPHWWWRHGPKSLASGV